MSLYNKRMCMSSPLPMEDDGLLRHIFKFLGIGYWAYVALVDNQWCAQYSNVCQNSKVTTYEAACGSINTFIMAYKHGHQSSDGIAYLQFMLGKFGSCELITQAHELGFPLGKYVSAGAATSGCVPKLKWLRQEKKCPWQTTVDHNDRRPHITYHADKSGNTEMIKYIVQEEGVAILGAELPGLELSLAITLDCVCILQYMVNEGLVLHEDGEYCLEAVFSGNFDALKFLNKHGARMDSGIVKHAAESGSIAMLSWLMKVLPYNWTREELTEMLLLAGHTGRLTTCKWLRKQGADWPSDLGHDPFDERKWPLSVLTWARQLGCNSIHPGFESDDLVTQ